MDQESQSPRTETSDVSADEFIEVEPEHYCCEHVSRDNRGLLAWIAFLIFLIGAFNIFAR